MSWSQKCVAMTKCLSDSIGHFLFFKGDKILPLVKHV